MLLLLLLVLPLGAQETKTLTVLQTSDMHSRVEPIDAAVADRNAGKGGMVRRAALINQYRKEAPNLLLVDCGDFCQGTPYYNLFRGEVEVKLMNRMGYDAITIGNHEFDYGMDNLARLFRLAKFSVVCANYDVKGTVLEDLVKPYVIVKRGDLKIGIFGVSPKLEGLVQADKCVGVTYRDPVAAANEVAALLKNKEKCHVVICLSHLSAETDRTQLIPQTYNIDFVFGGHSHTFMKTEQNIANLDGKKVPLLHSGKSGILVGRAQFVLK